MNEPTPLAKAEAAVTEAATNTDVVRLALAAVELAKTAQQQAPACQHHHRAQDFNAKKWLTIGGLVVAGGCVACFLAAALALVAVAFAIGGTCATACLLILRALWRDYLKGK
ncbi:hypothetical protein AB0C13_22225 [Streptomyces sp. NPDC049099]|uniref:hypothetical protein n=1 Tax=Streptomyces sp. NPDC049099 TaxID=3155768 RepID=UPI003442F4C8